MNNKDYIQKALGISADEYVIAVEQGGYQWINRYFHGDEDMTRLVSTCGMFWKWWINQWEIRDEQFVQSTGIDVLDMALDGRYWQVAFEEWLELHDVMKLQIVPNRWVIAALSKMIREDEKAVEALIKSK